MSSRRHGALDPIFERLMVKLVSDEPRNGYSRIDQIPELSDLELSAVIDHVIECCPDDFGRVLDTDALELMSTALRTTLLTGFTRNAAIGEVMRSRLQASARLWLVTYADEECQAENVELVGDYDRRRREEAGVPDHELSPSECRGVTYE